MQHVEVVNVAGSSLWTVRQGSGPALVCCHGGPGLWDYLEPVAATSLGRALILPGTLSITPIKRHCSVLMNSANSPICAHASPLRRGTNMM